MQNGRWNGGLEAYGLKDDIQRDAMGSREEGAIRQLRPSRARRTRSMSYARSSFHVEIEQEQTTEEKCRSQQRSEGDLGKHGGSSDIPTPMDTARRLLEGPGRFVCGESSWRKEEWCRGDDRNPWCWEHDGSAISSNRSRPCVFVRAAPPTVRKMGLLISDKEKAQMMLNALQEEKRCSRSIRNRAAVKIQKRFRGIMARRETDAIRGAHLQYHGLISSTVACGGCPFNHTVGHTAAVSTGGRLFSWGSAACGQLGIRSTADSSVPLQVGHCRRCFPEATFGAGGLLSDVPIQSVALGGAHSIALTVSGHMYAWGSATYGQLGLGEAQRRRPVHARVDDTDKLGQYVPASKDTGSMDRRKLVPVQVCGLSKVRMIACGRYHSMALTLCGSLWTWGQGTGYECLYVFVCLVVYMLYMYLTVS